MLLRRARGRLVVGISASLSHLLRPLRQLEGVDNCEQFVARARALQQGDAGDDGVEFALNGHDIVRDADFAELNVFTENL